MLNPFGTWTADDVNLWASWWFIASLVVGVVTSCLVIQSQSIKEAELKRQLFESNERTAVANREAAQAKLALGMVSLENSSRAIKLSQSKLAGRLKDVLPGVAEILYKPEDEEAYDFASAISSLLSINGWSAARPKPVPHDMQLPSAIAQGTVSKNDKKQLAPLLSDMPLMSRIGAGPLTFVLTSLQNSPDKHLGADLMKASQEAGFNITAMSDATLPKDRIRIIIGQNIPATYSFPPDK